MGRGDIRTRKGKISAGSFGNRRKQKRHDGKTKGGALPASSRTPAAPNANHA